MLVRHAPLVPLEPELVQRMLLLTRPGLGTLAQARVTSEFQCSKLAIVLGKSFPCRVDGCLDSPRGHLQFAVPRNGRGDVSSEMEALPLHALAYDLTLTRDVLADPQALPGKILGLSQQIGERPLAVIDRSLR